MSRKEKPLSAGPSLSSSSPTRFINRVKDSTGVSAVPIRSTSWPLWGRTSSGALWIPHRLATRTSDEPSAKSLDSESSRTASCLAASSAKPCPAAQHRVFSTDSRFRAGPNRLSTILDYQIVGDTKYFDAAGFTGRKLGLTDP